MFKILSFASLSLVLSTGEAQSLQKQAHVVIPQGPGYGFEALAPSEVTLPTVSPFKGCGKRCGSEGPVPPATAVAAPHQIPPVGPNAQSAAQIYGAFAQTMINNVAANPNVNAQFAAAGPYEVAFLSTEMYRNGGSAQVAQLLGLFAKQLNGPNLSLVRASFGSSVDGYVRLYSSAQVQASYFAQSLVVENYIQPQSAANYQSMGLGEWIPPSWDMTVNDIWWEEFVKAGATVQSAMTATALRVGGNGVAAFQAGYWIGTQIYLFLDYVDPNINIEIGNTLGAAVDGFVTQFTDSTATGYVDLPGFYDLIDGVNFTEQMSWYLWD
jgi:hypothetical protein